MQASLEINKNDVNVHTCKRLGEGEILKFAGPQKNVKQDMSGMSFPSRRYFDL